MLPLWSSLITGPQRQLNNEWVTQPGLDLVKELTFSFDRQQHWTVPPSLCNADLH